MQPAAASGSFHPSSGCGKTVQFALAGRGKESPTGLRVILGKIGWLLQSHNVRTWGRHNTWHGSKFCVAKSSFTLSGTCSSPALSRELDRLVSEGPSSAQESLNLWCGNGPCDSPSPGLSWVQVDEQLAQGWAASAKGTPVTSVSAPDGIPAPLVLVALCPQNGKQHRTKCLKMDELQTWGPLLFERITEVLTCKSLSVVRQEQTHPESWWVPQCSPVSHSWALNSTGGECHWAFHNRHKRFSSRNGQRFREVIFQFHTQNWFA